MRAEIAKMKQDIAQVMKISS